MPRVESERQYRKRMKRLLEARDLRHVIVGVELGFVCAEKGWNLQKTRSYARKVFLGL